MTHDVQQHRQDPSFIWREQEPDRRDDSLREESSRTLRGNQSTPQGILRRPQTDEHFARSGGLGVATATRGDIRGSDSGDDGLKRARARCWTAQRRVRVLSRTQGLGAKVAGVFTSAIVDMDSPFLARVSRPPGAF